MNVSVIMATYNGEKYIREQVDSILKQLNSDDELIISDDGSSDNTINIVREYKSDIIKIVSGPGKGVRDNFDFVLRLVENEIVMIADQDDIWCDDKVEIIKREFKENSFAKLIMHNAYEYHESEPLQESRKTIFLARKAKHGLVRNILYSTYYGCCIALRKEYMEQLLPFPVEILYDQYLGNCAELDKCSLFVNKPLIYHREHGDNWSHKRKLLERIQIRMKLMNGVFIYMKSKLRKRCVK